MALLKRNQASGLDPHLHTRLGFPKNLPIEGTGLHVQSPVVVAYVGVGETEGLVIHEQLDDFTVRHVQHSLACPCETIRFFGVDDWPGFIESVYKCTVLDGRTSLFRISAHAEIPVSQREDGFRLCSELRFEARFDQAPLVRRIVLNRWFETFVMKHR